MNSRVLAASLTFVSFGILFAGCTGPKGGDESGDRTPRRVKQLLQENEYVVPGLVKTAAGVATIQLYRQPSETNLPVMRLKSGEKLVLSFDIVRDQRRPLSVYFYHANRNWQRDLTPSQYLDSFQRDDILDYEESRATEVPYVHYRYSFPNRSIDFRVSGNYVVRVTEQGMEDQVILERAFYVTEELASAELALNSVLSSSSPHPAVQPLITFTPPNTISANVFGFAVCFIENGRAGAARCTDKASLARPPSLEYFLQPQSAFERGSSQFFLNLAFVQNGGQIEHADLTVSPFEVVLEPDYAQFGGKGFYPQLNGQPVVDSVVRETSSPGTDAEYVRVFFAFVPPSERPVRGVVHVVGGFNSWQIDDSNRLTWYEDEKRYEGSVLIKQGQYEYRYVAETREAVRDLSDGFPRQDYLYTSFVYYNDALLQTDRIIAVASASVVD